MKSQIHLIRHGVTEGNLKMELYGASDIPLAYEGIDQIAELAESGIYPVDEAADFYTSGMVRAEQTFFLVYGACEHKVIEALREMDFGAFENRRLDELEKDPGYKEWIADKTGTKIAPGGESFAGFAQRVKEGFDEILAYHRLKELSRRHNEQDANSIVVCHAGAIAVIMNTCFPEEKESFFDWTPDPAHGYTIELEEGKAAKYYPF